MRSPRVFSHHLPPFRTAPFLNPGSSGATIVLSARQREELAQIGIRTRLPARSAIYREQSPAQWVFAVVEGAIKSYRELRSGRRVVSAFLFAGDLFGLSANGRYVNTAAAITQVTLYRLPVNDLTVLLKRDGEIQFEFLAKVTHELREAQRRSVFLTRRDAAGRLAMFLEWIRARHDLRTTDDLTLPMTRSDIADFLGLSLESVSRAASELQRRRVVKFNGRHHVRILDATGLARLAAT
jgi:CRP/FNR family transcriptional regulator, anaerobic regulatory protein